MNKRDKELAIQCRLITSNIQGIYVDTLQKFADLIREDATEQANARANTSWALMCKKMVDAERDGCAKVVDVIEAQCIAKDVDDPPLKHIAKAIRARGET